jgi:hypothetical protein
MEEGLCSCTCENCQCTRLDCACHIDCYQEPPPAGCILNLDSDGNLVIDNHHFENCDLQCREEGDLTDEMACTLNNCVPPPTIIDIHIDPEQEPGAAELALERHIREVDVVFAVDNSLSMEDDQMASACAVDKFLDAATADGGQITAGVINTDLSSPTTGLLGITNPNDCTVQVNDCQCGPNGELPPPPSDFRACRFDQNGDWIEDPNELKKTIMQGTGLFNSHESGLQQAFRLFAHLEIQGKFLGPYETVIISDEEADGDGRLCPFDASLDEDLKAQLKDSRYGWNPPTPTGTEASCEQDLIDFFSYYFVSRKIMVHGLIHADTCDDGLFEETSIIYKKVIQATKGHQAPICDCGAFDSFMEDVGNTTSNISTQLCVDDPAAARSIQDDLPSVVVHYAEGGADVKVPQSATDGWTFDAATGCFVLSGAWEDKMGFFRVEYQRAPEQADFEDVTVCPANFDPIPSSIVVTCELNGQNTQVPQSTTDGWSLQTVTSQNCLMFSGSWSEQALPCSLEFRPNP